MSAPPALLMAMFLGSTLPLGAIAAPEADTSTSQRECTRQLLSTPDGESLGCLEADAPVKVEEHVPGWVRIRVEGWIPEEAAVDLQTPAGKAALSGSVIGPGGKPAGGAVARLVTNLDTVSQTVAAIQERHEASRQVMRRQVEELDKKLDRSLFSSDNLYEAKMAQVSLREEKQDLEKQIQALNERSALEVLQLFERHQVGAATADASGFFLIEGVEPGSYRLMLLAGTPTSGPAWYVPVSLSSGQRQRINLSDTQVHEDPFTPYR